MPSLAEIQTRLRNAVVLGADAEIASFLVGGRNPTARLAIHHRQYEASLVAAVLRRFPGVVWLVGEPFTSATAKDFIRRHPPGAPCIAEYAEDFPDFLARRVGLEGMPYVRWFAQLEWRLGQVALAVDRPPVGIEALSAFGPVALPDLVVEAQPGLRFLEAPWPVDDLMRLYLTEARPLRFTLKPTPVWLQVRGARGSFRIDRLDPGTFAFRIALAGGLPLGEAAERALSLKETFDPGEALSSLLADGLVTSAAPKTHGDPS